MPEGDRPYRSSSHRRHNEGTGNNFNLLAPDNMGRVRSQSEVRGDNRPFNPLASDNTLRGSRPRSDTRSQSRRSLSRVKEALRAGLDAAITSYHRERRASYSGLDKPHAQERMTPETLQEALNGASFYMESLERAYLDAYSNSKHVPEMVSLLEGH